MSTKINNPIKKPKAKPAVKTAPFVPVIDSKQVNQGGEVKNIPVLVNDSMTIGAFRWDHGLDSLRAGFRDTTSDSFIADTDMICSQITVNLFARSEWAGANKDVKSGRFEFLVNGEVVYTVPIEGSITLSGVTFRVSDKVIPPEPFIIKRGSIIEIKGIMGSAELNAEYYYTANLWAIGVKIN